MKKILTLLPVMILGLTGCQTRVREVPGDTTTAKEEVINALDQFHAAFMAKDAKIVSSMLDNDGLYCGTDPDEVFDKKGLMEQLSPLFADTAHTVQYTIEKREIRIDAGGNSALAMEQAVYKIVSPKIPVRLISHLIKSEDGWIVDFYSWNFIPLNEDIEKMNKALE
jgi:ketosteroid isomerase-like protein